MDSEVQGEFKYEQDSKRYHRFRVEADGVTGSIYIPKDSQPLPERLVLVRVGNDDKRAG